MIKPSVKVVFYEGIEELFISLSNEDPLKKGIIEAIQEIKKDCQAGEHISPKSNLAKNCLKKYGAKNIRVFDLPQFYRLIYSIAPNEIEIISVILDWPNHKRYDQLCKKKN
ncbi:unnamed protein product [marine sediment metagenome]|uniref:Plasmid stabilization system protein n=1 Tax=marine sediment metagenome TaxID=412755 RepID=X1GYG4_9ZZZZ